MHDGKVVQAVRLGETFGNLRVITIQSAMLVALGLLSAGFVVLLILPFYRRRVERLSAEELKRRLPMTEAEIRADKDRLRAEYAIRIHQLESRVDDASHQAARQRIELNRRDGVINGLQSEIADLRGTLEEHENARRVLEQTITDRLPKVEERLGHARQLLHDRDEEIERLTRTADQTARSLEEARQINTQQRDELMRSSATLASRAARNRDQLADPRFDGEVALRSEIEALRARTREQAEMITRLQGLLVRGGKTAEAKANGEEGSAASDDDGGLKDREIASLRRRLTEAENALRTAQTSAEAGKAGQQLADNEKRALQAKNDSLSVEVARLKASLSIYESAQKDDSAIKESKVAMKARLGALEAEIATHDATIQSLRAEVAAANERLARQAAHYRDELRRLGAGTLPTTAETRDASTSAEERRRPSLAERMGAPVRPALKSVSTSGNESRTASYLKALSGRDAAAAPADNGHTATVDVAEAVPDAPQIAQKSAAAASAESRDAAAASAGEPAPRRRVGLIDRISSASKHTS